MNEGKKNEDFAHKCMIALHVFVTKTTPKQSIFKSNKKREAIFNHERDASTQLKLRHSPLRYLRSHQRSFIHIYRMMWFASFLMERRAPRHQTIRNAFSTDAAWMDCARQLNFLKNKTIYEWAKMKSNDSALL